MENDKGIYDKIDYSTLMYSSNLYKYKAQLTLTSMLIGGETSCDDNDTTFCTTSVFASNSKSLTYSLAYAGIPTPIVFEKLEVEIKVSNPSQLNIAVGSSEKQITAVGIDTHLLDITSSNPTLPSSITVVFANPTTAKISIDIYEVRLLVTLKSGTKKVYIGSTQVDNIKLGNTQVLKAYVGSSLVFEK